MFELIITIFLVACYLITGCLFSLIAFADEWRGRRSITLWGEAWLLLQILLVVCFWPALLGALVIRAKLERTLERLEGK